MNERRTKIALERLDESRELVFRVEGKRWLRAHTTELRVGQAGLVATGDLGAYQPGVLRLTWHSISELHYGPSGRGAMEGLYACEGDWCSRCVLPWISEAQAEETIATIAASFPNLAIRPESALAVAVGEMSAQKALATREWLPWLGRRGVAVAAPSGRV